MSDDKKEIGGNGSENDEDNKFEATREAADTFVGTANYLSPEVIAS